MPIEEDDELLAPPRYGNDAAEAADQDDVGFGGFADSAGVVRLWFEDRRLVKARMSSIWYSKIPRGSGLEDCFRQAFMIARAMTGVSKPTSGPEDEQDYVADLDDPVGAIPGHLEPEVQALPDEQRHLLSGMPRLNRRSLATFHELHNELEARYLERLNQAEPAAPASKGVSGTSAGVTVHMTPAGFPDRVEFDQNWLEDQHTGSICSNVVDAAARALAKHEALPPTPEEPSDLEDLRQERELLRAAYFALLTPRGML